MKRTSYSRAQGGFTLIELMIAVTIGLFVMLGVLEIFLNTSKINRNQDNLSHLQETGRFATEFLSRDIRMAGYPKVGFSGTAVVGADGGGLNSSDSISVSFDSTTATGAMPDCLGQTTAEPAVNQYYIANDANGVPSLFCLGSGNATAQAILEGVENMQILYGVDTDGDKSANKYLSANLLSAADWLNVVSVRISLLLRTLDDNITTAKQVYSYNGTSNITAPDYRIRRVYETTVTLRNRLI
ncbi:MAG: PilW family protein [Burkholderiales bacterium]